MKHFLIAISLFAAAWVSAQNVSFPQRTYDIIGAGITAGKHMTATGDSAGQATYVIKERGKVPFTQQCVRQTKPQAVTDSRTLATPYFNVRMALPIPASYTPTEQGRTVGLDWGVYTHMHSAGMEVLPNGDVLAVYFSTPMGKAEADTATTFVQCRRRYGSDEWDMPELLFTTCGGNDQSALLFTDNDTLWFFGGGRDMTDYVPFRIMKSTDNGATWTFSVPILDKPLTRYTAQPISNAFRNNRGELFVALDGEGGESLLLRSKDGGVHWQDMGGRTGSRHSTIVMLDDEGTLLSLGGKNTNVNGWNAQNISHDWGATWETPAASPFPPLGTAQRPCVIRLQSGALCMVGDSYMHKKKIAPPKGWKHGNECYVALSLDNGKTWKIRTIPVTLPQHHRLDHPSLGYCTLRQGKDGLIHILTTTNYPGLEIEFNEAWLTSDVPLEGADMDPQRYITPLAKSGYYCLNGTFTDKFPDGKVRHVVTYKDGRRVGVETLYRPDGTKEWEWTRENDRGRWSIFKANGKYDRISRWNLRPEPRDFPGIRLNGAVADGDTWEYDNVGMQIESYRFHDGVLDGTQKQGMNSAIINQ